MVNKVESITIN